MIFGKNKIKLNKEEKSNSITENELAIKDSPKNKGVKYESPKILMIDCDKEVVNKIEEDGFDVEIGTFGSRYKVQSSGSKTICKLNYQMPNIIEKDVIIVNMENETILDKYDTKSDNGLPDGLHLYINQNENVFNPRNISAMILKKQFSKLTDKNSIIILFADVEYSEKYRFFEIDNGYSRNENEKEVSNYSFLPINVNINENNVNTTEYKIIDKESIFKDLFKDPKQKIKSNCTFYISEQNKCIKILENIYGDVTSYVRIEEDNGIVNTYIVLPQCKDMYKIISNLLVDILPNIYNEMFSVFVKDTWIRDEEYIFPKAKELLEEKHKIELEYKEKLDVVKTNIELEYKKHEFMYNIIISSGTGSKLVDNIKECLEYIGYSKVLDCDKTNNKDNEEDLHIYKTGNEYFVAEVKGVNGPPIEDDCNVIVKYKSRNCEKCNKSSIHGVVFFNYHKNVEPERREKLGFTIKEIQDAIRDKYTLVGTYEFFKAIRLFQEGIITGQHIKDTIETPGLFRAIPISFENIGKVENILKEKEVLCIDLNNDVIKVGEELLVIDDNNYFKAKILSIMIQGVSVQEAKKGDKVGIKLDGKVNSKSAKIYLIK